MVNLWIFIEFSVRSSRTKHKIKLGW